VNNTNYRTNDITVSLIKNCKIIPQKISCNLKSNKMKKTIFLALLMAFALVSCNQKNIEAATDQSHMINNDSTMMDNDSTMMNNKTKTMENHEKMYACSMHPEVQGKMNYKCSKCGMKLTEPVPEKTEESK
jgi:hypothetical protein